MFECRRKILGSADLQETSFYKQYSSKIFIHGQRPTGPDGSGANGARNNKVLDEAKSEITADAQQGGEKNTVVLDIESPESRSAVGPGTHVLNVVP